MSLETDAEMVARWRAEDAAGRRDVGPSVMLRAALEQDAARIRAILAPVRSWLPIAEALAAHAAGDVGRAAIEVRSLEPAVRAQVAALGRVLAGHAQPPA